MALQLWEALKEAIVAYTGLSPITFFTFLVMLFTAYYAISDYFAPSEPPPRPRNLEEMVQPTPPPVQVGEISDEELKAYDGSDPKKPLLMAIKGQIYDVSRSRMFYGPGGPYALFAGKDASRALAKMSFEEKDLNGDLSGLSSYEMGTLQDWEHQFMSKYDKVGTVKTSVPLIEAATDGEPSESVPAGGGGGDGAEATSRPTRDGPSEMSAVRSDEAPSSVDADKE